MKNDDYQERLNRLNQLNTPQQQTLRQPPRHTQSMSQPWWKKIPVLAVLLTTVSQISIWWIYPLIYSKNLQGGQWNHNPLLVTYTILIAVTIFFTFNRQFDNWKNALSLLIPFGFLCILYRQMSIQQVLLLGLLPLALFLIHLTWLKLQNSLGLILYSALATLSMPVAIFYQQNTYLTLPFIMSLLPLFFSYLFYMSGIFITSDSTHRWVSLVFGAIFLLNVLTLPWNFWTLLAIILIIFTWMILINLHLRSQYRMTFFSILQAITVLLIFLQQK